MAAKAQHVYYLAFHNKNWANDFILVLCEVTDFTLVLCEVTVNIIISSMYSLYHLVKIKSILLNTETDMLIVHFVSDL